MNPKPTSLDAAATASGLRSIRAPERLEHVGRARQAGRRAVAVLGDGAAGAGGDQRGRGRDVEGAAPAAGAGGVEQVVALRPGRGVASARMALRQPGELLDRLALGPQRDQEGGDLDLGGVAGHDLGEHRRGLVGLRSWPLASASIAPRQQVGRGAHRGREEVGQQLACPARSAPTRGGTGRPRRAARGGARPSRPRRRRRCARAPRAAPGRRPASGSARPRADRGRPRKIVRPSCSISVVLPCTGAWLDDLAAPGLHQRLVAETDAERRDPRLAGSARTASSEMPASLGVHGPGETITRS